MSIKIYFLFRIYFLFSHLDKFQGEIGYTHDGWLLLEPEERRYWSESFWKIRKNKISTFMIWLRLSEEKETRIKCPWIFEVFFSHTQNTALWKSGYIFLGKSLPLRTQAQVYFAIDSRHFTGVTDTQAQYPKQKMPSLIYWVATVF